MNLNLNNKNALVCGSTQGIGKATAIALAEEGVNVTLCARNEEKLKAVLSELPQHRNHNYIVADFSKPSELQEKVLTISKIIVASIFWSIILEDQLEVLFFQQRLKSLSVLLHNT